MYIIVYYMWFVVPVWTLGGRAAAPLLLWLAVVVAGRAWIKVRFLALFLPFASPDQKSHPPSSISTTSWLSSSSSSPSSFFYSFLLLLGFYLDFLILVFVLVRIMVDLIACDVDLLLFFTGVNQCGLICWFCRGIFYWSSHELLLFGSPWVYDVGSVAGLLPNLSI